MKQTKDSGINWIKEIPEGWQVSPLKNLFNIYSGATPKTENLEYWDGDIVWVTPSDFKTDDKYIRQGNRNITLDGYNACSTTLVKGGSIIFSKVPIGSVVINEIPLCTNQGCFSCVPKKDVFSLFYYYFLSISTAQLESYGAGTTFKQIYVDKFANFKVTVPPYDDQVKISAFLDKKTSNIKSLINTFNKQIDTLREYKKILISESVIKGLNPNAPLKESGIEWIGAIPTTWRIGRIKNVCKIFGRIGFRGYTENDLVDEGQGPITLSPSNFNDMKMDYSKCAYLSWDKYYESPEIQIHNGDILYVKTGSTFGKSCMVRDLPLEATINPQMIVMKYIEINPIYFSYFLQSSAIRCQSDTAVIGGTIPTISQEKIYDYYIVLPPDDEQEKIANYLEKKCSEIDSLISSKQQQIDKLNEYQKSLIYEYVTGKKEVV